MQNTTSKKPLYKVAVIGFVLIIIGILLAMTGPLGVRADQWGFGVAMNFIKTGAYTGIFGSLLCLSGLIFTRPGGKYRGFGYSLVGLVVVIPMIMFLFGWKQAKQNLPPIQDIATNTDEPLSFWEAPNSKEYGGEAVAVQQHEFYPDVQPLIISLPAEQVFDLALEIAEDRGWTLWNPSRDDLHIEATERTFWFGYSDDVSIEISELEANSSQVDMRSTSRYGGGGDGGTNANRIRAFFKDLQAAAAQ